MRPAMAMAERVRQILIGLNITQHKKEELMTTSIPHNVAREGSSDEYTPKKEDKFTFGLWTVGNRGRDPFGDFVRPDLPPVRSLQKLSELGAYVISLHDNDLVPFGVSSTEPDPMFTAFNQPFSHS